MYVRVGLWRKLSIEELMLLNVVLEKTLESPLDCKEIQSVHPKGDQSWVFIGRTDAEAETPILWPCDAKSWLIGKDPDAGKDWGQEEKGTTEDKMVGWHHQLDGHRFGWTLGVGDGQRGLACCGSWGHKESDTTEWLNWTVLNWEPSQAWLPPCGHWLASSRDKTDLVRLEYFQMLKMCSDPRCPLLLRWFLRGKQCLCLEFYFSSHCSVSTKDKLALTFPGFLLLTWSQLGALVANCEPWGWASGESYRLDSLETSNSVQFSCSVMSDSLWPYELQHASLPCLSPTPKVCSNSWPLSQ